MTHPPRANQWRFSPSVLGREAAGALALVVLVACGGSGSGSDSGSNSDSPAIAQPAPAPASYALTVTGGVGSASVAAQGQAEVWASVQPQSEVVVRWTGTGIVSDDEEWHATVAAGSAALAVTAQRIAVPVAFETLVYRAPTTLPKTLRLHIPPSPRGVILMLHGTFGNSAFVEKTEARYVALKAISKGYAVLAPEAEEAVAGDLNGDGKPRWDVALNGSNTDLQALDSLLASLAAGGRLPASPPRCVIGMSNGGAMATALGAVAGSGVAAQYPQLRFKAVVSYCAQARADAVAATRTPTAWFLCGNDDNADVSNAGAQANSAALAARGVPTLALLHPATPLHEQRFMRVAGVAAAQSRGPAADFQAAGLVDAAMLFNTPTADIAAQATAMPTRLPTLSALRPAQQRDVMSQIAVMRAEHEMFSDWASRSLRWFAAYP